jgi:hypothetical protein
LHQHRSAIAGAGADRQRCIGQIQQTVEIDADDPALIPAADAEIVIAQIPVDADGAGDDKLVPAERDIALAPEPTSRQRRR